LALNVCGHLSLHSFMPLIQLGLSTQQAKELSE
jgi:hypothetical protein